MLYYIAEGRSFKEFINLLVERLAIKLGNSRSYKIYVLIVNMKNDTYLLYDNPLSVSTINVLSNISMVQIDSLKELLIFLSEVITTVQAEFKNNKSGIPTIVGLYDFLESFVQNGREIEQHKNEIAESNFMAFEEFNSKTLNNLFLYFHKMSTSWDVDIYFSNPMDDLDSKNTQESDHFLDERIPIESKARDSEDTIYDRNLSPSFTSATHLQQRDAPVTRTVNSMRLRSIINKWANNIL